MQRESPEPVVQAFLLSRVGRYREADEILAQAERELTRDQDAEMAAIVPVVQAWLLFERRQYAPALERLGAAERLAGPSSGEPNRQLLVFAELIRGVSAIAAGDVTTAAARLEAVRSSYDRDERVESNWVAALDGEVALARGEFDRALSSFTAAARPAWLNLGRDPLALFAMNTPSRDGRARVEVARGNRAAAIQEYRRLTTVGAGQGQSAAVLERRHVLALARLLEGTGNRTGALVEYARFVPLWARADSNLMEVAEARQALARLGGRNLSGR